MRRSLTPTNRLALFVALCTIACANEVVRPTDQQFDSFVGFTYSGARTGSYAARGAPQRTQPEFLSATDYATAVSYPDEATRAGTVSLLANAREAREYGNLFLLGGVPSRPARVAFSPGLGGVLYIDPVWNATGFRADTFYVIEAGEITTAAVTGTRVQGTFRATAREWAWRGAVLEQSADRILTIFNGRFDVAIDDTSATYFRCRLFRCPALSPAEASWLLAPADRSGAARTRSPGS